jgi:hypothetical protein
VDLFDRGLCQPKASPDFAVMSLDLRGWAMASAVRVDIGVGRKRKTEGLSVISPVQRIPENEVSSKPETVMTRFEGLHQ